MAQGTHARVCQAEMIVLWKGMEMLHAIVHGHEGKCAHDEGGILRCGRWGEDETKNVIWPGYVMQVLPMGDKCISVVGWKKEMATVHGPRHVQAVCQRKHI